MTKRKKNILQKVSKIDEEFRISAENEIHDFLQSDAVSYSFPDSLNKKQRAFIHTFAAKLQLGTRSTGKEPNRILKIFKKDVKIQSSVILLKLCNDSLGKISNFLDKYYVLHKLKLRSDKYEHKQYYQTDNKSKLYTIMPKVPQKAKACFLSFRQKLPIWKYKNELIDTVNKSQVIIITGETGSGKTTQVPQFIVDNACELKQKCRVICTEPRRLSAISVAERVSFERGEDIGDTVGYQVHLESKVGNNTLLVYCTTGVLLRTLMNGTDFFKTVTHVIVDEVHERDKYTDFLLIYLKECLREYEHLKVILMSATIDITLFDKYFTELSVMEIPGRQFEVEKYYLENILCMLNYAVSESCEENSTVDLGDLQTSSKAGSSEHKTELSTQLKEYVDKCLQDCWLHGTDDNFIQLMMLYLSENVPIDYQHSTTGITGLIVACIHKKYGTIDQILNFEPDLSICSSNNMTALDWAKNQGHNEIIQMLLVYQVEVEKQAPKIKEEEMLKTKEQQLLKSYHNSISQTILDNIDFKLAVELVVYIHLNMSKGSILVFLAGYDDIIAMKMLITVNSHMNESTYVMFALHSSIELSTQRQIFLPVKNKRKIILSTNIAETSITIDDVVYVIDSGKVKKKSFDGVSGVCMLRSEWISQSCASQRAGRAGRTKAGICYRLFSQLRFNSMQKYTTAEILRSPLHELCLHTKLLSPKESTISDFFNKALEPPPSMIVKNAVQSLKIMGALDENENLTNLGKRLLKLSIEPHLAKIILYSIIVKCLDPVLIIACCLSSKDPFVLPFFPLQKQEAITNRQTLSSGTYSDHMVYLRAFQEWQQMPGYAQKSFCKKHYLNNATLEVIAATRRQIISQLRDSNFIKGSLNALNTNSNKWCIVKLVLFAGLYPNVAMWSPERKQLITEREKKVDFHSSSTLRLSIKELRNNLKTTETTRTFPEFYIFNEMTRVGVRNQCLLRGVTAISPITVFMNAKEVELKPKRNEIYEDSSDDESETDEVIVVADKWITFSVDQCIVEKLLKFREMWLSFVNKNLSVSLNTSTDEDDEILKTIIMVFDNEENAAYLHQPPDLLFQCGQQHQVKNAYVRRKSVPHNNTSNRIRKCDQNKLCHKSLYSERHN